MRYFCTYFDRNYLPRGLALYRSLQRHCPAFQLWVLCMDRVCYDVLAKLGLAGVHPIALADVPITVPRSHRGVTHAYHQYVVRSERRDE